MKLEISAHYLPRITAWHIGKILKWIDQNDLDGLECIRIMDHEPDDPDANKHPSYLTGYLYNGYYFRKKNGRGASIALYTRDLYFPIPKVFSLSPLARLRIAERLAHEVGHHVLDSGDANIHRRKTGTRKTKYQLVDTEEEAEADKYAAKVVNRMLTSKYYQIGRCLARVLSFVCFQLGNRAHWKGNFKRAARLEFRAYIVNHENTNAWQAYLQDRTALLKPPASLTDGERLWLSERRKFGSHAHSESS